MVPDDSSPRIKLLVIGYGNTLRSDDPVGPRVAEAVERLKLYGVRTLTCDLLTPELADPISKAENVIFVDACLAPDQKIQLRPLLPADSSQILAHAADPRALLALARDAFGRAPKGLWLTIPVENLEIGETLSQKARCGIAEAIKEIKRIASKERSSTSEEPPSPGPRSA
jgi:hydrogenase maturation protease